MGDSHTEMLRAALARARAGNLARGADKLAAQNKLFVRERIDLLCDPGTFVEDQVLANVGNAMFKHHSEIGTKLQLGFGDAGIMWNRTHAREHSRCDLFMPAGGCTQRGQGLRRDDGTRAVRGQDADQAPQHQWNSRRRPAPPARSHLAGHGTPTLRRRNEAADPEHKREKDTERKAGPGLTRRGKNKP